MNMRSAALIVGISALILAGVVLYLATRKDNSDKLSVPEVDKRYDLVHPIPADEPPPTEKEIQVINSPSPTPTVQPSSIKQIGNGHWRIHLTSKEWFDSGIPAIANQYTYIKPQGVKKGWLIKIGKKVLINSSTVAINETGYQESSGLKVDYDFHDTFKFKLDDESGAEEVTLIVSFVKDNLCPVQDDKAHTVMHDKYEKWQKDMVAKIARK